MAGSDFEAANLDYYHEIIKNWSLSKGAKKVDWLATAKNWMLRDFADGKLVKSQVVIEEERAFKRFLNVSRLCLNHMHLTPAGDIKIPLFFNSLEVLS